MGRCDVVHVKGRILPEPEDVKCGKVHMFFGAKFCMRFPPALHHHIRAPRRDGAFFIGQMLWQVMEKAMPSRLRFFGQAKGTVSIDVNSRYRIHLKGDFHTQASAILLGNDTTAWPVQCASSHKSVFHNVNITCGVDQRGIDAHLGQQPLCLTGERSNRSHRACRASAAPRVRAPGEDNDARHFARQQGRQETPACPLSFSLA